MVASEGIDRVGARKSSATWENLLRISMREAGVAVALVLIAPLLRHCTLFRDVRELPEDLCSDRDQHRARGGHDLRDPDRRHLSVGSVLALCTVVGATIMTDERLSAGTSITLAFFACLGTGAICGAINGWVCEKWKLPSFIVTLGMLNIASGLARVVSNNSTITGLPQPFVEFGQCVAATGASFSRSGISSCGVLWPRIAVAAPPNFRSTRKEVIVRLQSCNVQRSMP